MAGQYVPLVLIPRFTSYVGSATYYTVPLDVSAYSDGKMCCWRGPLVGDAGSGAGFTLTLEGSADGQTWRTLPPYDASPITTADDSDTYDVPTGYKWVRVKIVLTADTAGLVGITMWAAGHVPLREE